MKKLTNNGYIGMAAPELVFREWNGPSPSVGYAGYLRCVLKERDGTVVRDTGWFPNIITNAGLGIQYSVSSSSTPWFYMELGTGTGTAAATDTGMWTPISPFIRKVRSAIIGNEIVSDSHTFFRNYYRFEEGEATGTISEIGLYNQTSGGTMWSHALLVDGGGSPTTIVKGAEQILDVYYEVRVYPRLTDVTGTIDISGVSYDYTLRPVKLDPGVSLSGWFSQGKARFSAGYTNYSAYTGGSLAARTAANPTGSVLNPTLYYDGTHAANTYVTSNNVSSFPYWVESQFQCGIDSWHGTIDVITLQSGNGEWQVEFEKTVGGGGIVKTNEQRLRLQFRAYGARYAL